ncbi:MAG: dihydrolipoyllysine-residue acetyltransferase [Halothiobacillus sp. 24-54-40]|jgi:pyruvate dehydrogenase E2 component (dihydrolipoamide acetyltransferase)|nr:MAG: dihydrolipoyllysine-residue acetyltransferase [Halothiobacillus sp. 35-54-62]OYZ87973.1 MAG: dihydrolipoyllysine-residue acetyltransferase [Halothiobacillus sp. 24-54-40]OZA81409.1 MAG: dihydrolipoyllysine-residue acetyltransferase [Halothiobacillus sp. 39-53-45]HQS02183.1 dihydrolipoyllysine-residue acetyltransferase [Halothiobacillus sp.]HQS28993.1 dihydrolipoyllysine-residue acetyltransferase [Halothiobacillus sp.]
MTVKSIPLPDIGNFKDLPVIEVLVSVGDHVLPEQSLITLESDKATMEIPAPFAGIVRKVLVKTDDKLNIGDAIVELEIDDATAAVAIETPAIEIPAKAAPPTPAMQEPASVPAPVPVPTPPAKAVSNSVATPTQSESQPYPINAPSAGAAYHASPSVRAFARTLGVDLSQVSGTGVKSRIQQTDVTAFVKASLTQPASRSAPASGGSAIAPLPSIDFTQFGAIETVPLSRIQKRSGKHLTSCWLNIPHVTQFDETDITELEAFRVSLKMRAEKAGVKLTPLVFIMKAVARVLADMPKFNASLDASGENLILKKYIHIGVAVDTPHGLVVPVIRDVDHKGIFELSKELTAVGARAREGKLTPEDMSGGCFSISSLGGIGGTQFTPIVNGPEVAILGVSRAKMSPVWDGGNFAPRLMLPLALSYDHRVIDGAQGARFISALSGVLSDLRELIL